MTDEQIFDQYLKENGATEKGVYGPMRTLFKEALENTVSYQAYRVKTLLSIMLSLFIEDMKKIARWIRDEVGR